MIEAHESFSDTDIQVYKAFMQKYGGLYYLILIVKSEDREKCEEYNDRLRIYNELFIIDDLRILIEDLWMLEELSMKKNKKNMSLF